LLRVLKRLLSISSGFQHERREKYPGWGWGLKLPPILPKKIKKPTKISVTKNGQSGLSPIARFREVARPG